jgi:hypothetical protein
LTSETFRSALVSSVLNKPYIKTAQNPIVLKIIALLQVLGFFANKTVRHDITGILLKVALNTITLTLLKLL